jgi:hypothetical protein
MGSAWLLAALLQAYFLILLHYRDMRRTLKSECQLYTNSATDDLDAGADLDSETVTVLKRKRW